MMVMSQSCFEEALRRTGMRVCGGNLRDVPWSSVADGAPVGNVAWAGKDMGLFVVDWAESKSVELEVLASKDVVVCSAVLNEDSAGTDFAVGDCRFDARGTDLTMAFVPKHERFRFATTVSGGLKAVTLVVDPAAMMKTHGLAVETLPRSLLRTIQRRGIALEKLVPGHFGRIARDVAARRAMFPTHTTLYHE